jgi:hypothetical protein
MNKALYKYAFAAVIVLVAGCLVAYIAYGKVRLANKEPDVVIIGTELEGLYLAGKAKQEGLHPLILEPTDGIGGQLLQAEMLYLDGIYDNKGNSLMQGGFKELFDQYTHGKVRKLAEFEKFVQKLTDGIHIEEEAQIEEIIVDNGKVISLAYLKQNGDKRTVKPDYVVDNTDNAELVRRFNIKPLPGLESLYGSSQKEFMSATFMMKFKGVDWGRFLNSFWAMDKVERTLRYGPETYVDGNLAYGFPPITSKYELLHDELLNLRGLNILNQKDGEILINALQVYDVDPTQPETVEKAMKLAKEELPHIRDHLRKHMVGFEQLEISGEPRYLYIREYEHYPTEYVMEASDLLSGRMFWDNVSIGGYFLDIQGSRSNREGLAIGRPDRYGLPLRSYMLRGYDNVIVLGKLVGSTAVAYGSTRIQPNGVLAAESIGALMGQFKGRSLKNITEPEMAQFHAYVKKKYDIQLNGAPGENKIVGLSDADLKDLNKGLLTLLPNRTQARHLPLMRVMHNENEISYRGLKPVMIEGEAWVPLEETLRVLGAFHVRYDMEKNELHYSLSEAVPEDYKIHMPVHILNNHVLVKLQTVLKALNHEASWNEETRTIRIARR